MRTLAGLLMTLAALAFAGCAVTPAPPPTTSTPKPVVAASPAAATSSPAGPKTVSLALFSSDNPAQTVRNWLPIADKLAASLAPFGYSSGDVKVAPDTATIAKWLSLGLADAYSDSLNDAFTVMEASVSIPLLRRWKGGSGEYSTVIFTGKDSGITSLAGLRGQAIALQDPGSTSGYLLPVTHLLKQGLKVTSAETQTPGKDEVGYVFTWQDDKSIQAVVSGQMKAGATDAPRFAKLPQDVRDSMVVLAETERAPRGMLIARRDLDPKVVAGIADFFRGLSETADGKALLTKTGLDKFDDFPEGPQPTMSRFRELRDLLQKR